MLVVGQRRSSCRENTSGSKKLSGTLLLTTSMWFALRAITKNVMFKNAPGIFSHELRFLQRARRLRHRDVPDNPFRPAILTAPCRILAKPPIGGFFISATWGRSVGTRTLAGFEKFDRINFSRVVFHSDEPEGAVKWMRLSVEFQQTTRLVILHSMSHA